MNPNKRSLRSFVQRLLAERSFEEALVLLCLALAVAVLGPLALIRAGGGAWGNALFDGGVVVAALLIAGYLWRTRRARVAGWLTALACLGALVAVVYLFGTHMLFWAFPATALSFFLLRPATAAGLNLLAVALIAPQTVALGTPDEIVTFFVTLLTGNVLALIFATSMRTSRARLRFMAERDALTGARNRYALEPALVAAIEKLGGMGTPASLLAIDLDRFKQVNDSRGHEVGDRVLAEVTRVIMDTTRAADDVFRYGGEEFVVLANGAPVEAAGWIAEKLRQRIHETAFEPAGQVTVSIGVAEAEPGDTAETWFARADARLYEAKRAGRDCVRVEPRRAAAAAPAVDEPPDVRASG